MAGESLAGLSLSAVTSVSSRAAMLLARRCGRAALAGVGVCASWCDLAMAVISVS